MKQLEKKIQKKFNKGCVDYGLFADGDKILVALSGGKDSLMLLKLMAARARIFRPQITVEAAHVIMDNIPYETDRSYIEGFCKDCGVKLHILHSSFDESTDPRKTRCFLCSWNRRKRLFEFATENGFNKVALGHHMDDILTTLLMNMTFEGNMQTMMPMLKMEHYPISIIRPMCLVAEEDVRQYAEMAGFHKQKVVCPYEEQTNRKAINDVFHTLEKLNPEARYSLWRSVMK